MVDMPLSLDEWDAGPGRRLWAMERKIRNIKIEIKELAAIVELLPFRPNWTTSGEAGLVDLITMLLEVQQAYHAKRVGE